MWDNKCKNQQKQKRFLSSCNL